MGKNIKELNLFLHRNNAYKEFYCNFKKYSIRSDKNMPQYWKEIRDRLFYDETQTPPNFIQFGFEWEKTKEGMTFWENLSSISYKSFFHCRK